MIRLIFVRVLGGCAVMAAVATMCFFLLKQAPGGPFESEARQSVTVRRALEERYHLHDSLWGQYTHFMGNLVRGDLGYSIKQERPVWGIITAYFPTSAMLGLLGLVMALGVGVTLGIAAAWRRNSWVDYSAMLLALLGVSLSSFVIGPMLIAAFAMHLGWLPPARVDTPAGYILPAVALGVVYMGTIARMVRGGLIETLGADYIRTARAKGLPEHKVILRHALRVGILPVISYLGPAAAGLISGSFVVEKMFQIPGLGMYFVNSIADRDYELVTGVFVFYVALLVVSNVLVDLAQAWLDPRSRQGVGA